MKLYALELIGFCSRVVKRISTRPDLSYSASVLGSFVTNPNAQHWEALKRVIRYCKGTLGFGITLSGYESITPILVGYSDADWG